MASLIAKSISVKLRLSEVEFCEGESVKTIVGLTVGTELGKTVGFGVEVGAGVFVGFGVAVAVGAEVGFGVEVGIGVGVDVGVGVGAKSEQRIVDLVAD